MTVQSHPATIYGCDLLENEFGDRVLVLAFDLNGDSFRIQLPLEDASWLLSELLRIQDENQGE